MIEVTISGIFVSLVSQTRVIVLKDIDSDRYVPIFIGTEVADAINLGIQKTPVPRPMTHDLLKNIITELGGKVSHIVVNAVKENAYLAEINVDMNGKHLGIDSRPSDALALAVRMNAKIFVAENVMEQAAVTPESGLDLDGEGEDLGAFDEFIDTLDLDDL